MMAHPTSPASILGSNEQGVETEETGETRDSLLIIRSQFASPYFAHDKKKQLSYDCIDVIICLELLTLMRHSEMQL
jgi:hypothetical protein